MTAPNKGVLAAAAVRLLAPYLENAIFNVRNADKAAAALVKHHLTLHAYQTTLARPAAATCGHGRPC